MVATDAGSAVSTQATEGDTTASDTTTSIERVVATTDHKVVGRLFVGFGFLALMFSLVGAALAQKSLLAMTFAPEGTSVT